MSTIEKVEKLKEKANVSYEEAKEALEATSGDILDALILLEKKGKVKAPENDGRYTTTDTKKEEKREYKSDNHDEKEYGESFSVLMGRFFRWCGKVINKGNIHVFEVRKRGEVIVSVPLTVLVLLLIFAFWVVLPLIVVGLFFGYRYYFRGPDLDKSGINKMMNTAAEAAADAAENIKKEIKESDN